MDQIGEKRSVIPLYIKAELIPERVNVVEICVACERVTGKGSIDGATLVNRLWRVLTFNEVSRAKLLTTGIQLANKLITFEGKNPFLHPSGEGERQSTKLIVKNLPFSYSQEAVERNLVKAGFKVRGKMMWMKGRSRTTGHLTDFRDGRRAVFIDLPTGQVNQTIQMGPFRARIEYNEMKTTCYRCLQEGHTARNCMNTEVCHNCRKPGHRKDQCPDLDKHSDIDSDSDNDEDRSDETLLKGKVGASLKVGAHAPEYDHDEGVSDKEPPSDRRVSITDPAYNEDHPLPKPAVPVEKPMPRRRRIVTYADAAKSAPIPVNRSAAAGDVGETSVCSPKDKGGPSSTEDCHVASGNREDLTSPMTEFIKSVEFKSLPESTKTALKSSNQASDSSLAAGQTVLVETPTKRSDNDQASSSLPETNKVTSVWGDPIEVDDSDEKLIIAATAQAENEEPVVNLEGQVSDTSSSKKAVAVEGTDLQIPANPSLSRDQEKAASAEANASARLETAIAVNDLSASAAIPKVNTGRESEKPKLSKIKRAFSAIISPPTEKNRRKSDGPLLKKKSAKNWK